MAQIYNLKYINHIIMTFQMKYYNKHSYKLNKIKIIIIKHCNKIQQTAVKIYYNNSLM